MLLKRLLCFITVSMLSASASAMLIHGNVGWGGEFTRTGDTLTFSNVEVDFARRDLGSTGIADGTPLVAGSFDIGAGFTPGTHWISNGFTLSLNWLNVVMDDMGFLNIVGSATVSGNNYQATNMRLLFSGNIDNFSARAVPEPQTALMALTGLIALIGLRRRRALARA